MFRTLVRPSATYRKVGVVGLGIGSLAAYAKPDQHWTFFELDPAVIHLARNADYFTFLHDCRAQSLDVIPGDARLQLARLPDHSFDVLVLDAFSSDAIPIHLLTIEAMNLYQQKLARGGILLFHVSNRYLDLPPILGRLSQGAQPALIAKVYDDRGISDEQKRDGKDPSIWVLMARQPKDFGILAHTWTQIKVPPRTSLWSDDHANVLGAFRKSED